MLISNYLGRRRKQSRDLQKDAPTDSSQRTSLTSSQESSGRLSSKGSSGGLPRSFSQWVFSRSVTKAELEADDSDSSEEDQETKDRKKREHLKLMRIKTKDLLNKRERAFNNLGTEEDPEPGTESRFLRFQRRTGILEFRVGLALKKIRLEDEPPYFKDVHEVVNSLKFEAFVGLLIILNAFCIAWDAMYDTGERRPGLLTTSEHIFTALFLTEWFLRILAFTTLWLCNPMNLFDTFLIWVTGVFTMWILYPAGIDVTIARRLNALRILRLARLCKAVRLMKQFKELWMLVQGVMECTSLLVWAIFMGCMVNFTYSVLVLEMIVKSENFKDDEDVQYYFGNTLKSMFTLFQIMTLDSWSMIVRPIIVKAPEAMLLFGSFMGLAGIVLFNLMTAIVVQNAYDASAEDMEAIAEDKRRENAKIHKELMDTFEDLDEDGSGALSQEEFNDCLDDYLFVRKMKMLDIDLEELPDIFEILDDGDGQVSQEEFIGGMMKMQGRAQASEMLKATTMIRAQNQHYRDLKQSFFNDAKDTFARMEGDYDRMHVGLNDIMQLTGEVMNKLDEIGIRRILKATVKDLAFLDEPTLEDIAAKEKRARKLAKKGRKEEVEDDIEDLVPREAKLPVLPPSWVIKEERSFEAKNPGMVKLKRDPSLKERLKYEKMAKARQSAGISDKRRSTIRGPRRDLGSSWAKLGLPLTELSFLRAVAQLDDGSAPPVTHLPVTTNYMPDVLVPSIQVNTEYDIPVPPAGKPPELASPDQAEPHRQSLKEGLVAVSRQRRSMMRRSQTGVPEEPLSCNSQHELAATSQRTSLAEQRAETRRSQRGNEDQATDSAAKQSSRDSRLLEYAKRRSQQVSLQFGTESESVEHPNAVPSEIII